jgi:hypothetical protein
MKVLKLNTYVAVTGFFLAAVVSGQKTVLSAGGTVVENSRSTDGGTVVENSRSTDGKTVMNGGKQIVTNPRLVEPSSAMPSAAPSVSPSAEPSTAAPSVVSDLGSTNTPTADPDASARADASPAPRTSGMAGMILLSLLTWVISL